MKRASHVEYALPICRCLSATLPKRINHVADRQHQRCRCLSANNFAGKAQGIRIIIFLEWTTLFFSQLKMKISRESRESRENIHCCRSYVAVRKANASETMRFSRDSRDSREQKTAWGENVFIMRFPWGKAYIASLVCASRWGLRALAMQTLRSLRGHRLIGEIVRSVAIRQ